MGSDVDVVIWDFDKVKIIIAKSYKSVSFGLFVIFLVRGSDFCFVIVLEGFG